jgi:hypothetical protein
VTTAPLPVTRPQLRSSTFRDKEMAHPNRHLAGWKSVLRADPYGDYNDRYRGDQ